MTCQTRTAVLSLVACLCGFGPRPSSAASEEFAFFHENVMGTSLELRVKADSSEAASSAERRVLREIDRLSSVFSGYDPGSEFSRWQRTSGRPVPVSPELFEVLQACDHWRSRTDGAFDPRVAALSRLWSDSEKRGRLPTAEELSAAKVLMSRDAWKLDPLALTAERLTDCPLTLDAIAKGYIVGRACGAALEPARGVRGLLLNVGGDMRVCGETVGTIGIADPSADSESSAPLTRFEVRDRAVATSGRSQRGFMIDGRWHSHIFDPRTGRPVERTAAATVLAANSADADALATAFNVLAPDECVRLAGSLPGVECLIVTTDGRVSQSVGWATFGRARTTDLAFADDPKPPAASETVKNAGASPWGDEYELRVNFEINRPQAEKGRYRRPYVAVWVEDKDGFAVRNLTLWVSLGGSGPFQWLPDMKRWYQSDQARKRVDKTDMVITIARPTRPPGKYTVIWDGKDDHGKPLGRGQYTLCIDAAREHGTYQGLRTLLDIADAPFTVDLKGGVEIKAASVEYLRKAPSK